MLAMRTAAADGTVASKNFHPSYDRQKALIIARIFSLVVECSGVWECRSFPADLPTYGRLVLAITTVVVRGCEPGDVRVQRCVAPVSRPRIG